MCKNNLKLDAKSKLKFMKTLLRHKNAGIIRYYNLKRCLQNATNNVDRPSLRTQRQNAPYKTITQNNKITRSPRQQQQHPE